jgi:hypothetical protein
VGSAINFLRAFVGILGILFAYQLGRVGAELRSRGLPLTKATTWFLRVTVTTFAVIWVGGFDLVGICVLAAVVIAFGAGVWQAYKPKHDDSVHLDLND